MLLQNCAGLVLTTVGLWGIFTAATLGTRYYNPVTGTDYDVLINYRYIAAAWAIALVCICLSLPVASKDKIFGTSQSERMAIISSDIKKLSLKELRIGGKVINHIRLLLGAPSHILEGGFLMGTGMIAIELLYIRGTNIHCYPSWRWGWMAFTAVLSYVVSVVLVWVLFRPLTWKPKVEIIRIVSPPP